MIGTAKASANPLTKWDLMRFRKGQLVIRIFYGIGDYTEADIDKVSKVSKGVVYTEECESITFDSETGKELENFFPPMRQQIYQILG